MIYGLKGWYWDMPNGKVGVAFTCHRLINKIFNPDTPYTEGEEKVFYCSKEEAKEMRIGTLIQVPKKYSDRQKLAKWYENPRGGVKTASQALGIIEE